MNFLFSCLVLVALYSSAFALDEEFSLRFKDLQDSLRDLASYSSPLNQNEKIRDLLEAYNLASFPHTRSLQAIPPRSGLSKGCNNKLCDTIFYELTCKAEGINMTKICAEYLVGNIFSCSDYPSPEDFYDAPSICANEIAQAVVPIVNSPNPVASLTGFLYDDFGNNTCGRNCWQKFQNASLALYGDNQCLTELKEHSETYKFMSSMATFQPFRNQACANINGQLNCFSAMTTLMNNKDPSSDLNVLTPTCDYFGTAELQDMNMIVKSTLCEKLSQFRCCAATSIDIIYGNQVNSTDLKIFPPCLLSYLENFCPTVSLTNYCTYGSVASQTFTRLKIFISKAESIYYPAVYNTNSLLQFNAALSTLFTKFNLSAQPYNFQANYPFQVKIYDFVYYDADGNSLTPTDGSTYYPAGADYQASSTGDFYVQIYLQHLTMQEAKTFEAILQNPQFAQGLKSVFGVSATSEMVTAPTLLAAQPLTIDKNFSIRSAHASTLFLLGTMLISFLFTFY